jgi:HSP20 family protein
MRSFFEKLTGVIDIEEEGNEIETEDFIQSQEGPSGWMEEEDLEEGELAVDVYHTPESVVIKAMVAGIDPDDLDISITRERVIIKGKRRKSDNASENDYFHQELYWGAFTRTIVLSSEIDTDNSKAKEDHGLLTITLQKANIDRQTKLKVK